MRLLEVYSDNSEVIRVILELFALMAENYIVFLSEVYIMHCRYTSMYMCKRLGAEECSRNRLIHESCGRDHEKDTTLTALITLYLSVPDHVVLLTPTQQKSNLMFYNVLHSTEYYTHVHAGPEDNIIPN